MALNIYAKFERKMTCAFKNDMMNLANFHHSTFESLKCGTFIGLFYPKWKMYELKVYRGAMCHDNEKWCKIWRGIDFSVQNWHEEFKSQISVLKNLKNLHFNGLLLNKVYNIWAKKVQRSYVRWHWILMQNLKKHWLVVSKMTWRIWQIFVSWLENSDISF